jgi:Tol biopolymer transport system component
VSEHNTEDVLFAVTCAPRIDDAPGEKLVVAMKSSDDEDENLHFMELDGRTTQRLTDNVGDEFSPEISPDGNRILFVQFDPSGRSLKVLDRVSRQETALPTVGVDRAIWSRDGSHIAFIRGGRLFRMKSDGTQETPLTSGTDVRDPYWSPDGSRIAFTRNNMVFVVNVDGSGLRQISVPSRTAGPWSPDGRSIILTRLEETCDFYYCYYYGPVLVPSDLVILNPETGQETALTQTPLLAEWSPVWSSDGLRIYFLSALHGNPDVHVIGLNGGQAINLSVSSTTESWISIGRVGQAPAGFRGSALRR